jgi:hypothetical protein
MKVLPFKEKKTEHPPIKKRGLAIKCVHLQAIKIDSEELEEYYKIKQGGYVVISPDVPVAIALTEKQLTSIFQFTN